MYALTIGKRAGKNGRTIDRQTIRERNDEKHGNVYISAARDFSPPNATTDIKKNIKKRTPLKKSHIIYPPTYLPTYLPE